MFGWLKRMFGYEQGWDPEPQIQGTKPAGVFMDEVRPDDTLPKTTPVPAKFDAAEIYKAYKVEQVKRAPSEVQRRKEASVKTVDRRRTDDDDDGPDIVTPVIIAAADAIERHSYNYQSDTGSSYSDGGCSSSSDSGSSGGSCDGGGGGGGD